MNTNAGIDFSKLHASMTALLKEAGKQLAVFLEKVLSSLFEDWWKQAVLNSLSSQQRQRIKQQNIKSLSSLDLAALLRVLDQNWYQISMKLNLERECRHYVKEMQTIRNRWAHLGLGGFPVEDVYRDLDTLQRFAKTIESDEEFLHKIQAAKNNLLTNSVHLDRNGDPVVAESSQGINEHAAEFELGQIVSLKSNPEVKGAIVSIMPGKPENRYKVFLNGQMQTYYASQLQSEAKEDREFQSLPCEQFHAYLTALQIRYPGLSTLYSLNAARVDFIPYQFRPVLRFIRSDRPRLLIADGVGVGKTIEAGLILRELQARRDIQSILIVCPRPLVIERKWEVEMKRFEEHFTHLDGKTLRYCINEMDLDGVWPEQYRRIIVSYSSFDDVLLYGSEQNNRRRRRKGLLELDPPPRFDLIIVDEAHHIRNQETYSHKAVRFFCEHAEAAIFLTATPIQLGSHDLFVLLNVLRPDLIIDEESFEHMAEPNPYINRAVSLARTQEPEWSAKAIEALDQAASTGWGKSILMNNPELLHIRDKIKEENLSLEERVRLITDIEALHTFAGIINRTRRRDIGNFTIRKPETVIVEFTQSQKQLHDDLLQVQAEIFSRLHGNINVKFMMTTIRRQAASCIFGLAPFLEDILKRHLDELSWEEADDTDSIPLGSAVNSIETQIQSILEKARFLNPYDPKLEALRRIIIDKLKLPNNKLMLFSSFRHTLSYLYKHLKADNFRIGMVHGDTPDEERIDLRNRFALTAEDKDALDVLLFSEIGCEGLDYQFCDCIVNYDLPWNPMKVEQRIGRIDRNGQKSESVTIFNLITPGTVDADIYERCLVRIGVFKNALGGSEEILGEITREIKNIAENFLLSEKDRREKLQQLADNKILLIQEQERLEERQLELFGIRLPEAQMKKDIEEASSYWLSPKSINRLVTQYLQKIGGSEQEYILGDKPFKTLRLSQELRNSLLMDLQKLPRQKALSYREWENWLRGGNPHLSITFEQETASQHPEAAFITPIHPLVKQAALSLDTKRRIAVVLKVRDDSIPPGKYPFVIYQWQFLGVKEDLLFRPVASIEAVTERLSGLLQKAIEAPEHHSNAADISTWKELEEQHYKMWSEACARHQEQTREIGKYRRESLTISHRARILLLEEQLRQANNEKIQRMRQSQIAAAEADYGRRMQDLEIALERADIIAEMVAYGVICIEGEE